MYFLEPGKKHRACFGTAVQVLIEKNGDEKTWLSMIERLRDEIYELKSERLELEDRIKDLKEKNQELAKSA